MISKHLGIIHRKLISRECNNSPSSKSLLWTLPSVSIIYASLIFLFFYPYINDLDTEIIGDVTDAYQDFWNTWYTHRALSSDPGSFFSTKLLYYPEGASLLHHSFAYSNTVLIYGIIKTFALTPSNAVLLALHNSALLLSYFLGSVGGYLLCKYLTRNNFASFVAGFIFAFSPFHHVHFVGNVHIATIQYLPFFVLFFLRSIENNNFKDIIGAAIFFVLCALSSWYYLVYNLLFLSFYTIWYGFKQKQILPWKVIVPTSIICGITIAILSPLIYAMAVEASNHPKAYNIGHRKSIVDLSAFFVFYPFHGLNWIAESAGLDIRGNITTKTAYLGLVNLTILAWYWRHREAKHKQTLSLAAWGTLFFMLWGFGTWLHILGTRLPIPMPHLISQHIPLIANLRIPSRAMAFVYLFFGIMCGIAVSHFIKTRSRTLITTIILLLIMFDFYPTRITQGEIRLPEAYEIIRQDEDSKFGILEIPSSYTQGNRHMMYQTFHGKKIMSGSVSRKIRKTLIDNMIWDSLENQSQLLQSYNIKYIVIDKTKSALLDNYISKYGKSVAYYRNFYNVIYEDGIHTVIKTYD